MALLPNATAGLQWSTRWRQPYFTVPAGVYTPDPAAAATIWVCRDSHTL
jgi:hypothetical protein